MPNAAATAADGAVVRVHKLGQTHLFWVPAQQDITKRYVQSLLLLKETGFCGS